MLQAIRNNPNISILIIVVFHIVGLLGFSFEASIPLFQQLVPMHLLLMAFLLFLNHKDWNTNFYIFLFSIFLLSFSVEAIGTNTGKIFGQYYYLSTLGYKVWNTPLLIGINWLILVYSVGITLHRYKIHAVLKSIIGALVLVGIDYYIEPVAIRFDYWTWTGMQVPLQNYIAWTICGFVFLLMFNYLKFEKSNSVANILLIVQTLFFIFLQG